MADFSPPKTFLFSKISKYKISIFEKNIMDWNWWLFLLQLTAAADTLQTRTISLQLAEGNDLRWRSLAHAGGDIFM